jgi:hypothetical protein
LLTPTTRSAGKDDALSFTGDAPWNCLLGSTESPSCQSRIDARFTFQLEKPNCLNVCGVVKW